MASKNYNAEHGYTLVGFPEFPFETEDELKQKAIEGTKAFNNGKIWIQESVADEDIDNPLAAIKFPALRKMASMSGCKEVHKLTKVELIEFLEKEGF